MVNLPNPDGPGEAGRALQQQDEIEHILQVISTLTAALRDQMEIDAANYALSMDLLTRNITRVHRTVNSLQDILSHLSSEADR